MNKVLGAFLIFISIILSFGLLSQLSDIIGGIIVVVKFITGQIDRFQWAILFGQSLVWALLVFFIYYSFKIGLKLIKK